MIYTAATMRQSTAVTELSRQSKETVPVLDHGQRSQSSFEMHADIVNLNSNRFGQTSIHQKK